MLRPSLLPFPALPFFLLAFVFSPPSSHAQTLPKTGLFPPQTPSLKFSQTSLQSLGRSLLSKVEQSGKAHVIKDFPLLGSAPPPPPFDPARQKQQDLAPLTATFKAGLEKVEAQEFEAAIEILKKSLASSASQVKWPEGFTFLSRSLALLALSYLQLGQNDQGELLLKTLARLDPQPLPPEIQKTPIMRRLYNRVLSDVTSGSKADLRIIGTPGATVFVDGKQQGLIPVEVKSLSEGYHYIRVESQGFYPFGQSVLLKASSPALDVQLQRLPQTTPSPLQIARQEIIAQLQALRPDSETFKRAASEICKASQLDLLLSLVVQGEEGSLQIVPIRYDCKTQEGKAFSAIPLPDPAQAEDPLEKSIPSFFPPDPPADRPIERRPDPRLLAVTPPRTPPPPPARSIAQEWWFWTILGVAVVGGGVTTAVILLQPPKLSFSASWPVPLTK